MAGYAADGRYGVPFVILIEAKIFFVDLSSHTHHVPGNILFRFFIAGKIQVVGGTVLRSDMAEITFYTEGCFEATHHLIEIFVADVLGQDLEIPFWFLIQRFGSGHAYYHESDKRQDNSNFFVMQHVLLFCARI